MNFKRGISIPMIISLIALIAVIGGVVVFNMQPKDEIMMSDAVDMIEEGEKMIREGEDMMEEGEDMMEEALDMKKEPPGAIMMEEDKVMDGAN